MLRHYSLLIAWKSYLYYRNAMTVIHMWSLVQEDVKNLKLLLTITSNL